MPRVSASNHPVAVLRKDLGLLQKEFAEIVGCSLATIQSVELGRLELSQKLAARISERTGVSMEWLLRGKAKRPIPAAESMGYHFVEYSRNHFDLAQSRGLPAIADSELDWIFKIGKNDLEAVFRSARELGPESAKICFHRISSGLDALAKSLEEEFGSDNDFARGSYVALVREFLGNSTNSDEEPPSFEFLSEEEVEERFKACHEED